MRTHHVVFWLASDLKNVSIQQLPIHFNYFCDTVLDSAVHGHL